MLLTDRFEYQVAERLRRRTELLLKGVRGTTRYQHAVVELYHARSQTVHSGDVPSLDLTLARRAFVLCFLSLMRRLPTLPSKESSPLSYLTGDI
jgi:hypothetical protein